MTRRSATRSQAYSLLAARASFILLGASIPISTALDGILTGVIVLAWLVLGRYRETLAAIRANPVMSMACLWLVANALGALYSIGSGAEIGRSIGKAAMFLLLPMAAAMLENGRDAYRAHCAFMTAIGLTVALAYLRWIQVIPPEFPGLKTPGPVSPSVVFKYHLTQNLLIAFGAFVFAVYACGARSDRGRAVFAASALLCAATVLIVGDGRIGQIVLVTLCLYYGAWRGRARGVAVAAAVATVALAAAYAIPGSSLQKRAADTAADAAQWRSQSRADASSVGDRLDFYGRSLAMISENPLLGVGTGGFPAADRRIAEVLRERPTANPHNEYLLRAVELGIAGPLLMIAMFWTQWRAAARLADERHTAIARGLVLAFAVASTGTSTFNDHVESLLYIWMTALLFATQARAELQQT